MLLRVSRTWAINYLLLIFSTTTSSNYLFSTAENIYYANYNLSREHSAFYHEKGCKVLGGHCILPNYTKAPQNIHRPKINRKAKQSETP